MITARLVRKRVIDAEINPRAKRPQRGNSIAALQATMAQVWNGGISASEEEPSSTAPQAHADVEDEQDQNLLGSAANQIVGGVSPVPPASAPPETRNSPTPPTPAPTEANNSPSLSPLHSNHLPPALTTTQATPSSDSSAQILESMKIIHQLVMNLSSEITVLRQDTTAHYALTKSLIPRHELSRTFKQERTLQIAGALFPGNGCARSAAITLTKTLITKFFYPFLTGEAQEATKQSFFSLLRDETTLQVSAEEWDDAFKTKIVLEQVESLFKAQRQRVADITRAVLATHLHNLPTDCSDWAVSAQGESFLTAVLAEGPFPRSLAICAFVLGTVDKEVYQAGQPDGLKSPAVNQMKESGSKLTKEDVFIVPMRVRARQLHQLAENRFTQEQLALLVPLEVA